MSGMRAARDESQADPFAPGRLRGSLENRWDSSVGGLRAEKLEARVQPLEACLALSDRSVAEESASSGIDEARQAAAHAHVRLEALEERHIAALPGGPPCFLLISPSPIRIIFVFHSEFLLCGRELWPCVTASPSLFLRRLSSRRVSSCFFLVSSSAMRVIFVFDDESRTCRMESYSLFTASVFRVCFLFVSQLFSAVFFLFYSSPIGVVFFLHGESLLASV